MLPHISLTVVLVSVTCNRFSSLESSPVLLALAVVMTMIGDSLYSEASYKSIETC